MRHTAYLSLGSNIDPRRHILAALDHLKARHEVFAISCAFKTEPMDCPDQACFLNLAVGVRTALEPMDLYHDLKAIEAEVGRKERSKVEPREIDIDILLFDDLVADLGRLCLPHRSIPHFAYVLGPLLDIAPSLLHPGLDQTIEALYDQLDDAQRASIVNIGPLFTST